MESQERDAYPDPRKACSIRCRIEARVRIFDDLIIELSIRKETESMVTRMSSNSETAIMKEEVRFLADLSDENPYIFLRIDYYYYGKENSGIILEKFKNDIINYINDQFKQCYNNFDKKERNNLMEVQKEHYGSYSKIKHQLKENGSRVFKNLFIPFFPIFFILYLCNSLKQSNAIENANLIAALIILYSQLINVYNNSNSRNKN